MLNRLKVATLVIVTLVGMFLYKQNFDAKAETDKHRRSDEEDERW